MKTRILQILQQSDQPVSGEHFSRQLGISRVAVWKHIHGMQAAGYKIQSTPKGYRLLAASDAPLPWVFGERSHKVHHFAELPSTMDKATELARQGCENFSIVVTDHQTRGRGRLQRSWQSEQGGLYFTMVLRPRLDPGTAPLVNLAAAVDLAGALMTLYPIEAKVKWPNDVLVGEGKIAGILSQMAAEADCVHFICLGIGVNVNNRPPEISPPAVSVAQLTGAPGSRAQILSNFYDRFEQRMRLDRLHEVIPEWKKNTLTLGRHVVIQTIRETVEGTAVDLDSRGGLMVEMAGGERRTVLHGDCFHGAVPGDRASTLF